MKKIKGCVSSMKNMKIAKIFAFLGLIAMIAVIINGFLNGNFIQDGADLIANPWGIVSLVDLYVGFTLFSLWIIFREKSPFISIIWIIFMMVLGFFTASLYLIIALHQSKGDWLSLFLGARKSDILNKEKLN